MRALQSLVGLCLVGLAVLLAANPAWSASKSSTVAGDVGLYFDAAGTIHSKVISPASSFDVYLVARVPEGGIASYHLVDLDFTSSVAPLVLRHEIPAGSAFSKQEFADDCSRAVATIPSSCPSAAGETVPLIRFTLQYFGGDSVLCLQGFKCPTIAGSAPSELYYESCDEPGVQKILTLEEAPCVWLDGRVATGDANWGMLKSRFGSE